LLSDPERDNGRSIPKPHQPLRRSSSKSCRTLPGTLTRRRLASHCPEPPLPRRMSPLRSSRARRSSCSIAPRAAFCNGMI
jgi:hypothetical protein